MGWGNSWGLRKRHASSPSGTGQGQRHTAITWGAGGGPGGGLGELRMCYNAHYSYANRHVQQYVHQGRFDIETRHQDQPDLGVLEAQGYSVLVTMLGPGLLSHCSGACELSLLDCALPINQLPL